MFKKSDLLPLILALVSTVLVVVTGFNWLTSNNFTGLSKKKLSAKNKIIKTSNTQANLVSPTISVASTQGNFILPVIVPQGTSVTINGSSKLNGLNIALRKGFRQRYPGTVIITNADGSDVGLNLLYSGDIDLLALDRSLNQAEQAAGLTAIEINKGGVNNQQTDSHFYYVYKNPLDPDIEAFLGYALSDSGKEAMRKRQLTGALIP